MGLDTSHDCWHGAYSAFHRWRCMVAELKGLPPLELMQGFYVPLNAFYPTLYYGGNTNTTARSLRRPYLAEIDDRLPIKWDCLKPDPIHELLYHSDCDGQIHWSRCKAIAESLAEVIPLMHGDGGGHIGNWVEKTQKFVDGLLVAYWNYENVDFH